MTYGTNGEPLDGAAVCLTFTDAPASRASLNSTCVVYINDNVAYTNRIYGMQKNPWSINSYSGTVEVSAVKVSYY